METLRLPTTCGSRAIPSVSGRPALPSIDHGGDDMSSRELNSRALFVALCALIQSVLPVNGAPKETPKAELTLKDANGQRVRLRDYRGKVVVLNFWATWCVPCNEEMPMLVEAE